MLGKRAAGPAREARHHGRAGRETAVAVDTAGGGRHAGGRVAGLDGVRAFAVLAVFAFHAGIPMVPGGFLGVDVFFALSGYLITDLLAAGHARAGRLDLRGFWVRRARRLLPALAATLVVVTAAVALVEPGQMAELRPALAAAVTYSSNWYQAFHHVSYFESFGPPPPLQHLWSLAIEEQFYLAWPLLLLLAVRRSWGRRALVFAAWLGALASAAAMAVMYVPGADPSRVYYGTDTHATALLVGAALALTWPLATVAGASRRAAHGLDFLGAAALAVLAWGMTHFSGADPVVYPLGLAAAALAAGGLALAAAAPGRVGALLSLPPLRWTGRRSYGIYLWHWPVIAVTAAIIGPGGQASWVWAAEAGVAVTLAAVSWRWLEEPILRNGWRASCRSAWRALGTSSRAAWRSPARAVPAVSVAAALAVIGAAGYGVVRAPSGPSAMELQILQGERADMAGGTTGSLSVAGPAVSTARTPSTARTSSTARTPSTARTSSTAASPAPCRVAGRQITAIGDSVMAASGMALGSALPGIYVDAKPDREMPAGLQIVRSLEDSGRLRPVVVMGLGTNYLVTTGQLRQLTQMLGPDRKLVLVNTYVPDGWSKQVNATMAAFVRQHPGVVLADWFDSIRDRTYLLWPDKVHPQLPGTGVYARMLYRAVQETCRPPAGGAGTAARAVTAARAGTTSRATAPPATAERAAAHVQGRDITAVGDSVMLAVSLPLQQAFPGIYVNAVVSRFMYAGLSVLQKLAAGGRLRPVVIVGLGTNGGVTTRQVRQLMAIVGSNRKVVLVNTFVPLPYEQDTNSVLAAAARTYPNVVLANWNQTISHRTNLLWQDGIHPQPSGGKVYAAMIKTAVAAICQARAAAC